MRGNTMGKYEVVGVRVESLYANGMAEIVVETRTKRGRQVGWGFYGDSTTGEVYPGPIVGMAYSTHGGKTPASAERAARAVMESPKSLAEAWQRGLEESIASSQEYVEKVLERRRWFALVGQGEETPWRTQTSRCGK
jgi:hypothetical protein